MAAKKSSTKEHLDSIKTRSELAKLMGRHKSQVTRWLQRDDWAFSKTGPWPRADLPSMLRWAADVLARPKETEGDASEDGDSLAALKRQKLEQQVRKLRISADNEEMRNRRERASVIDRHLIEPALMRLADVLRSAGDALTRRFGNEAAEMLTNTLDDFERGLNKLFDDLGDADNEQPNALAGEPIPGEGATAEAAYPAAVR